jgi:hypothetical protein
MLSGGVELRVIGDLQPSGAQLVHEPAVSDGNLVGVRFHQIDAERRQRFDEGCGR